MKLSFSTKDWHNKSFDEFCNIGSIPDFNKKISTFRSRNIALIPIMQNIRTT